MPESKRNQAGQIFYFLFCRNNLPQPLPGVARAFNDRNRPFRRVVIGLISQWHSSRLQHARLKFRHVRIQRRGVQGLNQSLARVRRIDNRVHPEPRRRITWIGLVLVGGAHGFVQFFFVFDRQLLTFALKLLDLDFHQRPCRRITAHHRIASRRPRKNKSRVVSLSAHRIVPGSETPPANHRNLRHHAIRHGIYHLRPRANNAAPFRLFPHHEPIHVVKENQRNQILIAIQNKPRRFICRLGINHAAKLNSLLSRPRRSHRNVLLLIRHDPHRPAANARKSTQHRLPILGAILLELAAIHNPRDDLPHVVLLPRIRREYSVDFIARMRRRPRRFVIERRLRTMPDLVRKRPDSLDARFVVWLAEIYRAADLRVHFRPAKVLRGSFLPNRGLYQRRPREKQPAALRHENVITHHRQIRPARHAHPHNRGNLRNPLRAHHRVVPKHAPKIIGIGKHIFLQRKENASGIHQVNCRNAILDRDILRANHLLRRHREERASFHRRIIRDDHHLPARHAREANNRPRRRRAAPLVVHLIRRVEAQLEKFSLRIDQLRDTFPRRQPPLLVLRLDRFRPAALPDSLFLILDFSQVVHHLPAVLLKVSRLRVHLRLNHRPAHRSPSRAPLFTAPSKGKATKRPSSIPWRNCHSVTPASRRLF